MLTADFDYDLPPERIAQAPLPRRDQARMMVLEGGDVSTPPRHARVADLPALLRPGDLLVLNDTRVMPARLTGCWADTRGSVELLLIEPVAPLRWRCICRSGRPVRPGAALLLASDRLAARIVSGRDAEGAVEVAFDSDRPLPELLEQYGQVPLPPYIRRAGDHDARAEDDRERYQTVYAAKPGAVAAPTAGLHFTPELLQTLAGAGIEQTTLTLHVGPGTFRPVTAERIDAHAMEAERYIVPDATARALQACRARGGRIVAVGSTSVRTLETMAAVHAGRPTACEGRSSLFIRPPYRFQMVDAMLTNFHLPRSTLLMMVAAFIGRERMLAAYREALRRAYRFYSYGDCMLLLPGNRG